MDVEVSTSLKDNCYDNAPVGSFFCVLKNEQVRHRQGQNQAEAQLAFVDYIKRFDHRQRVQHERGVSSPDLLFHGPRS